jgi:hypothetical protein
LSISSSDNFDSHPFHAISIPGGPTPSHFLGTSMTTGALFNYKALPPEVQNRYLAFSAACVLHPHTKSGPLQTSRHCHRHPDGHLKFLADGHDMHSFILRDGRRFVALPQIDTKQLSLNPPKFLGLQPHDKRKWYDTFWQHCLQYGVYVHPWLLFEQNHGGFTGSECSDTSSGDLPGRLETYSRRALLNCLGFWVPKACFPLTHRMNRCLPPISVKVTSFFEFLSNPTTLLLDCLMIKSFPVQNQDETNRFQKDSKKREVFRPSFEQEKI